jgi:hypothetical protein
VKRRGDDITGPPLKIRVRPDHLTNVETGELIDNLFVKKKDETSESERPEGGTPGLPVPKGDGSP